MQFKRNWLVFLITVNPTDISSQATECTVNPYYHRQLSRIDFKNLTRHWLCFWLRKRGEIPNIIVQVKQAIILLKILLKRIFLFCYIKDEKCLKLPLTRTDDLIQAADCSVNPNKYHQSSRANFKNITCFFFYINK